MHLQTGRNVVKKISFIFCILGILLGIGACGDSAASDNALEEAYDNLYKNDFSYTCTIITETSDGKEEGTYTGEVQASPYIEYRDCSEVSSVTPEIYYYGNHRMVDVKMKTTDGKWIQQKTTRPYLTGYHEQLDILSEEEAEIDDVSCTKYNAQYTESVGKLKALVPLEVYLDSSTSQIKRIVVDETGLMKKTEVANLMNTKGMSEEEAEKAAEKDRDANESHKYIINITYGEVNLTVPE